MPAVATGRIHLAGHDSDEKHKEDLSLRREFGGELLKEKENNPRASEREREERTIREGFEEEG